MKKNKNLAQIEFRMRDWSRKYRAIYSFMLGIPSKNIVQHLKEQGGILSKYTGKHHLHSYPEAEEIETIMIVLSRFDSKIASIVRRHYLDSGSTKDKANAEGISESAYFREVIKAHHFIAGAIEANKAIKGKKDDA